MSNLTLLVDWPTGQYVQGAVNLYDVTAETGGTVVIPRSHLAFGTEVAGHRIDASVKQPVVPCAFVLPLLGELRTNNVESRTATSVWEACYTVWSGHSALT